MKKNIVCSPTVPDDYIPKIEMNKYILFVDGKSVCVISWSVFILYANHRTPITDIDFRIIN